MCTSEEYISTTAVMTSFKDARLGIWAVARVGKCIFDVLKTVATQSLICDYLKSFAYSASPNTTVNASRGTGLRTYLAFRFPRLKRRYGFGEILGSSIGYQVSKDHSGIDHDLKT